MLATLLVGQTPSPESRHVLPTHFNVPPVYVSVPVSNPAGNVISNGGFESGAIDGGWYQCGDTAAYATKEHPYAGAFAAYSGTPKGTSEPLGDSGVCQRLTIPPDAVLSAHLFQLSNEETAAFSYQEADLLNDRGDIVLNLYKTINNKAAWIAVRWNLAGFAGRTLWLYFGVHGDGYPKRSTEQFVDEVMVMSTSSSKAK